IWKKAKVGIDYHIAHEKHYYSVPHQCIKQTINCRITTNSIECFLHGKRIAHHQRYYYAGHTTIHEHMPKAHKAYVEWTPERLTQWANEVGPQTQQLIKAVIDARALPQQGFRACLGILRLGKKYGNDRLEKAAALALKTGALRYQHIESILKKGLEQFPLAQSTRTLVPEHTNVRGHDYFKTPTQSE
ncbi:MAG: IS21 family transposase, partial [Gammaproteobacteria bacterium]